MRPVYQRALARVSRMKVSWLARLCRRSSPACGRWIIFRTIFFTWLPECIKKIAHPLCGSVLARRLATQLLLTIHALYVVVEERGVLTVFFFVPRLVCAGRHGVVVELIEDRATNVPVQLWRRREQISGLGVSAQNDPLSCKWPCLGIYVDFI